MSKPKPFAARLGLEFLEDRTTPTFLPGPSGSPISVNGVPQATGGLSIAAGDVLPDKYSTADPRLAPFNGAESEYVTGSGPGTPSLVQIWSRTGTLMGQFSPFGGFSGGINVAIGDVLGDSRNEIIVTVAGNGPPAVGVFNPNGEALSMFLVNGNTTYTGGLNVAVGNVQGGIGGGGFYGSSSPFVSNPFKQEIVVGTATQMPVVVVMDAGGAILESFNAFDPAFKVGVTVATANLDSTRVAGFAPGNEDTNAYDEIIVGATSLAPGVSVWKVDTGAAIRTQLFLAYDTFVPANTGSPLNGGVTLAAGSTDGVRGAEIFVSLVGTSRIRAFNGESGGFQGEVSVYPSGYSHVVNMAVAYLKPGGYNPLSDDDFVAAYGPSNPGLSRNPSFDFQDLAVVAGDGPFNQQPRFFMGAFASTAGLNGP